MASRSSLRKPCAAAGCLAAYQSYVASASCAAAGWNLTAAAAIQRWYSLALTGCGKTGNRSMRRATLSSNEEVGWRGDDEIPEPMFSYVLPEQRVPQDHPLRPIRAMVDVVLKELSPRFARLYAKTGRPSIPPEKLLRALLFQVLYSVR